MIRFTADDARILVEGYPDRLYSGLMESIKKASIKGDTSVNVCDPFAEVLGLREYLKLVYNLITPIQEGCPDYRFVPKYMIDEYKRIKYFDKDNVHPRIEKFLNDHPHVKQLLYDGFHVCNSVDIDNVTITWGGTLNDKQR